MNEEKLIEYLNKYFIYHSNGKLSRMDRKNSTGSYDKDGYLIIKIKGKQYKAHRLVYAIHHGKLPVGELDHINRVRDDNRIENLRLSDRTSNVRNSYVKPNKDTGVRGVHFDSSTKGLKSNYTTRLGGKTYRFKTLQEAIDKRKQYYGDDERMFINERID